MFNKLARFLRRSIVSDPHLGIAFVVLFIFMVLDLLHALHWLPWEMPHEGLLFIVAFAILMLVAERIREGEQVRENADKLRRIDHTMSYKRVAVCCRPSKVDEYGYLWGGFTGTYWVYNPSYQVDKIANEEQEIVKMFIHRYQNPQFEKARYLFLTKDDSGKADLEIFKRMMLQVKQAYPAVTGKIKVKEMKNMEACSESEMYLGTRYGEQRGVVELKQPAFSQHGMPHYYLVIDDKEVLEHYLKNPIEKAWNDKNATDIDIFANG